MKSKSSDIHDDKGKQEKLKMLGELVSGITHEINTPMHYLENNLTFLKTAIKDLLNLDDKYRQLLKVVKSGESISIEDWQALENAEKTAEIVEDFDSISIKTFLQNRGYFD